MIFSNLTIGEIRSFSKPPRIWGMWMYISALILELQELLIVVALAEGNGGNYIAQGLVRFNIMVVAGRWKRCLVAFKVEVLTLSLFI